MIILGDTNCDFSLKVADEYSSSLNSEYSSSLMGSTKWQLKTISTRKLKNFNSDNFLSDLGQIDWDNIISSSKDINEAVNKWSYLLSLVIEKHAPLTDCKVSDKYASWLTKEFKALCLYKGKT